MAVLLGLRFHMRTPPSLQKGKLLWMNDYLVAGGGGVPEWTTWCCDWQWHPKGVFFLLATSGRIPQLPSSAAHERDFPYSRATLISLHNYWPSGSAIPQLPFPSLQDSRLHLAALAVFLLLRDANHRILALATPSAVWKTLFLRS